MLRYVASFNTGVSLGSFDTSDATDLLSERSPVCQPVGAHSDNDTLPAGLGERVRVTFDLSADESDFPVYQFEGLYYPFISIGIEGESAVRGTFRSAWSGSPPATVITCKLLTEFIELRNVGGFPDYVSGSVVISAPLTNAYAEYRDSDGLNPCYDKDTGAQLITPLPLT